MPKNKKSKRKRPPQQPSRTPLVAGLPPLTPESVAAMNKLLKSHGYALQRTKFWSRDEVDEISTDEIFRRLHIFNIRTDREQFLADVTKFLSASQLAKQCWYTQPYHAEGADEDFPWMAAETLWKRLAPELPCAEMIDDWMQQGYDSLAARDEAGACRLWMKCWNALKERFLPGKRSVREVDKEFCGTQSVINWCQDFEMQLGNATTTDPDFHRERVRFCREFADLLPDTEPNILGNMGSAEGESLFALGQIAAADAVFAKLAADAPDDPWPYIGWGDLYSGHFLTNNSIDLDRAEQLYREALARAVGNDVEVVRDRIKLLRGE